MRLGSLFSRTTITFKEYWLFTTFACFFSLILTCFLLNSTNTLFRNGNWFSSKRNLDIFITESDSFLITRKTLKNNTLNLGTWGSYNEVISRKTIKPKQISFQFKLSDQSYLDIIFAYSDLGYQGIRLSNHSIHPSIFFSTNQSGAFSHKEKIDINIDANSWHISTLAFENDLLKVILDGREIFSSINLVSLLEGKAGFHNGLNPVIVDNIEITNIDGSKIVDSFNNFRNFLSIFLAHTIAICVVLLLLRLIFGSTNLLILQGFTSFCCLTTLWAFDHFYWSNFQLDPYSQTFGTTFNWEAAPIQIEKIRTKVIDSWARILGYDSPSREAFSKHGYSHNRIISGPILCKSQEASECQLLTDQGLAQISISKSTNARRILFVGTSQSVGAGANVLSRTVFARLHQNLYQKFKDRFQIESLNMSVSGSNSTSLLHDFVAFYKSFSPDYIFINLGTNDTNETILQKNLEEFARISVELNSRLILIKEANSDEGQTEKLSLMHKTIEKVAVRSNLRVLDLNRHMLDIALVDSGNLWWDFCHMTAYGQEIAGNWLASKIVHF